MNTKIIAALAMATVLAVTPTMAKPLTETAPGIVRLAVNGEFKCSAAVTPVGVITAAHCVTDPLAEYSIQTETRNDEGKLISQEAYSLDVKTVRKEKDTALLTFRDAAAKAKVGEVEFGDYKGMHFGDGVAVLGYPSSQYFNEENLTLTEGHFQGFHDSFAPGIDVRLIRTDAHIWYGSSGGALFQIVGGEYKFIGVTSQQDPSISLPVSLFVPVNAETFK